MNPILPIEPSRDHPAPIEALMEEIWPLADANVRALVKGKASRQVLVEFFGSARGNAIGLAHTQSLDIQVRNPGGLCAMSQVATEHWMTLSILSLRPAIDAVLEELGHRFGGGTPELSCVLEVTPHTPIVEVNGVLYLVERTDDGFEIVSDDGMRKHTFADLPPSARERIRLMAESRHCECPLCVVLRSGRKKPIDIIPLRTKIASVRETNSLHRALANPKWVRVLNIYERQLSSLPEEIGSLENLEDLNAWDNNLASLPESIGRLTRLLHLNLSNNPLRSLPATLTACPLQKLDLDNTEILELPPGISGMPLETLSLGFRENPPPEGFLPFIARLATLRDLTLSNGWTEVAGWAKTAAPESRRPFERSMANSDLWIDALDRFPFVILSLRNLTLYNYALRRVPPGLASCKGLVGLTAWGSRIGEIPEFLQALPLEKLDLSDGTVDVLPPWIGELRSLDTLALSSGGIPELPMGFFDLQRLSWANLSENAIRIIPDEVGQLTALKNLYLDRNPIKRLSPEISRLPKLEMLSLRNVPNAKALVRGLEFRPEVRVLI